MRTALFASLGLMLGACVQTTSTAEAGGETGSEDGSEGPESESETGAEPSGWQTVLHAKQDIGALMSVWGPSPAELFVVGGQPEPGGGRVLRGHDDDWELEPLPPEVSMLNWVYGVDGQVWSVGLGGAIVRREANGWIAEASPTDRVLWGVWGASSAELWSVGGDGVSDAPVLLRRDGSTGEWSMVELPPLGVSSHALFKVPDIKNPP